MYRFKIRLSFIMISLPILFAIFKLCGIISWPWIWILSPVWLPIVLFLMAWGVIYAFSWLLFRDVRNSVLKGLADVDKYKHS
jgi:ABC-type polysaccharide/polyol phosphate export permease